MEKVNSEVAINDVNRWMDAKRIPDAKRQGNKDSVETLVDAVTNGDISIGDDNVITHTLIFPIQVAGKEVTQLQYQPRLAVDQVKSKTSNVKAGDVDGRLIAYASAITGESVNVIGKLDSSTDYSIALAVAVFFM